MTLLQHQIAFTRDLAKLTLFANALGVNLTLGEGYRTDDQQELYFYGKVIRVDDGVLELINGVKRTKTMFSNHLRRLAQDYNFVIKGKVLYDHPQIYEIGKYWESLNVLNRWGGHFKDFFDSPHFERNVL